MLIIDAALSPASYCSRTGRWNRFLVQLAAGFEPPPSRCGTSPSSSSASSSASCSACLPGVGSITALSILIPITFYMEPVTALAFLIGITKGGTSGGAIPAILLNAPGSSENVATARDGYPLAQEGQAGEGHADGALFLGLRRLRQRRGADRPGRALCRHRPAVRTGRDLRHGAAGLHPDRRAFRQLADQGAGWRRSSACSCPPSASIRKTAASG